MTTPNRFTFVESEAGAVTAETVGRFISAFEQKDATAIAALVADECVMEAMQPAPDGQRVEGYQANVAFWQAMVADPSGTFEVEEVLILGNKAVNRWRYRFGADQVSSVRGVTLITVRDGKITEALAYAKTPAVSALGQAPPPASAPDRTTSEVIRRFNDAFQRHDPSGLPDLVAPDCIIENSTPAPNGSRHVGREACVELWQTIATSPGIEFELEDVSVAGETAIIRWRLRRGADERDSVRGVNLMRLRDGLIVEAHGYVKGG